MWSLHLEPSSSSLSPLLLQLPLGNQGGLSFLLSGILTLLGTVAVALALGYVILRIWRHVRDSVRFDSRERH